MKTKDIFAYSNPLVWPIVIGYGLGVGLYNICHGVNGFDKEMEKQI
jgi:hypothetical protein